MKCPLPKILLKEFRGQLYPVQIFPSTSSHFLVVLCEQRWERSVIVPRLEELAQVEILALTGVLEKPEDVRMHSCGVDSPQ